jgi:hypothetical protein
LPSGTRKVSPDVRVSGAAVLRVQVMSGPQADEVATGLREHDSTGLLSISVAGRPGLAALVIDANNSGSCDGLAADVVLSGGQALGRSSTTSGQNGSARSPAGWPGSTGRSARQRCCVSTTRGC